MLVAETKNAYEEHPGHEHHGAVLHHALYRVAGAGVDTVHLAQSLTSAGSVGTYHRYQPQYVVHSHCHEETDDACIGVV